VSALHVIKVLCTISKRSNGRAGSVNASKASDIFNLS